MNCLLYTSGFEITFNNGNKYSIVNGKDGSVVEIGENGNWFIDGVDTGKPARGEKGETGATAVSYTHLDVYKRQAFDIAWSKASR